MKANILNMTHNPKRLHVKRKLATKEGVEYDLSEYLSKLFKAFSGAVRMFEEEIVKTPPQSRARAFEASLLNSKMIQSIQEHFPKNWKFGKYKRFLLNLEGYTVLFKKLNNKNMPMNIKTSHTLAISNQMQTSLFDNESISVDPILFFGYRKDKTGRIFDPKLVYIDENKIQWTLTNVNEEVTVTPSLITPKVEKAVPVLKDGLKKDKKTS